MGYGKPTVGGLFVRALRAYNGTAVALSEPQLFALQRLLVLHARDDAAELTPEEEVWLRIALAAIPGTILKAADEDADVEGREDVSHEEWLRFFIGKRRPHPSTPPSTTPSRAHTASTTRSPTRQAARRPPPGICPFEEWLHDEYDGLGFLELQAAGLAFLAGSRMFGGLGGAAATDRPAPILGPTRLAGKTGRDRSARSPPTARPCGRCSRLSPQTPRRQAREILPFLRRPALRQADGRAMVIAPRADPGLALARRHLLAALPHRREQGAGGAKTRFFHFHGFLHERYATPPRLYVAHPWAACAAGRLGAAGVVHSGRRRTQQDGTSLTSDVILDDGTDHRA